MQSNYPILEFDPSPEAIIEPARVIQPMEVPEQCVICFFQEVIAKVVKEHNAKVIASLRWEDAEHPIYEM
jgi:uridine phosphorylase